MSGYYTPISSHDSYVLNKRDDDTEYTYDSASNAINLDKQAALQSLNNSYSTTISSAYSQYLIANQSVMGSSMGQGYKEAYLQAQQAALTSDISNLNVDVATARSEVESSASDSQTALSDAYDTEVSNLDRVTSSFASYKEYLSTLSVINDDGTVSSYLTDDQLNMDVEDLYDVLVGAQPQGYTDSSAASGKTYLEWVYSSLSDTTADQEWSDWLFKQGGYSDFLRATQFVSSYD